MVVERHEQRVHDNAQRDEQLGERIEDQPGNALLELQPWPAAVPDAEDVDAAAERHQRFVAERRSVLVVLLCWEIVHGD